MAEAAQPKNKKNGRDDIAELDKRMRGSTAYFSSLDGGATRRLNIFSMRSVRMNPLTTLVVEQITAHRSQDRADQCLVGAGRH